MPAASKDFWVRLMRALAPHQFTLIDIGCSGGIDPTWLEFGNQLQAFGFDPNIEEVERLNASRPGPGIEYVAGFVGLPFFLWLILTKPWEGRMAGASASAPLAPPTTVEPPRTAKRRR